MDIYTYQGKSFETAIYPHKGSGKIDALSYVGLGLGESGEVQLKIQSFQKQENQFQTTPKALIEQFHIDIIDELGDYFWYGAGLATELGINLEDILKNILGKHI